MPLYDWRCQSDNCDREFVRFVPLKDFEVPQSCSFCGGVASRIIRAPFVRADIAGYVSPVTGQWIGGRKQRREDLLSSNSVEFEPGFAEECRRNTTAAERKLELAIENTVDAEISRMPARKQELLDQEVRAGASAEFTRITA